MSTLFEYQIKHFDSLLGVLEKNNIALDASSTGTGKTFVACAVAKKLGLDLFIVCPKSVVSSWKKCAKSFDVNVHDIMSYEKLKMSQDYVKIKEADRSFPFKFKCEWNLPDDEDLLIIFDEAHRCKNINSQNGCMLAQNPITNPDKKYDNPLKLLLLSATISDKMEHFAVTGYVLNIFPNIRFARNWMQNNTVKSIRERIFHSVNPCGSRMSITELGKLFPDNFIQPETFQMSDDSRQGIQDAYMEIKQGYEDLKNKEDSASCILEIILRARQQIELLKVPTFVELTKDFIENGNSVAIFVNFNDTAKEIMRNLSYDISTIHGKQSESERNINIEDFQSDKTRIIIANIKAGGVGISLHDLNGKHPRVSLISPTWNAIDLKQSLGRIHRAGAKSPAIQKIVFCSDTVEDMVCQNVKVKIENIDTFNEGNLVQDILPNIQLPDKQAVVESTKELNLDTEGSSSPQQADDGQIDQLMKQVAIYEDEVRSGLNTLDEESDEETIPSTTVVWEWQNRGSWNRYGQEDCDLLEHLMQTSKNNTTEFSFNKTRGFIYELDFANMKQINTNTGMTRNIRRICSQAPTSPDKRSIKSNLECLEETLDKLLDNCTSQDKEILQRIANKIVKSI